VKDTPNPRPYPYPRRSTPPGHRTPTRTVALATKNQRPGDAGSNELLLVVLSRVSLNISRLLTDASPLASDPGRFANPGRYVRTRVTAGLARDVTARYERGESMRTIALTLGMGKATVLKILHAAELPIKPAGRHY
jgi:hypothetical protein